MLGMHLNIAHYCSILECLKNACTHASWNVQLDGSSAHYHDGNMRLESATLQDLSRKLHDEAFISMSHVPLIAVQVIAYIIRHQLPTHGTCFKFLLHAFI